jgi:hypothetical protein
MRRENILNPLFFGGLIALGLLGASAILAHALIKFRSAGSYVTVKGLAEKDVKSDSALWKIKVKVSGNDFNTTSQSVAQKNALVQLFLKNNGFTPEEIGAPTMRVIDLYAREFGNEKIPPRRYLFESRFSLSSKNVDLVAKAASRTSDLIAQGIILEENDYEINPKYYFTKLNDIRPEMLAEAMQSARVLAEQFARDSHSKVGSIKFANQGVFHISDRESSDGAALSDVASVMKKIRVVSTIDYYLTE